MAEERLTREDHWQNIHQQNRNLLNILSNSKLLEGYYHFALFRIIRRFWDERYRNFMEIGCAPGNYLVKFKKNLGLETFGVEYEKKGYEKTIKNVSRYGIPESNIVLADFFDQGFLQSNKSKFDIVFSAGFIEHFDKPEDVIKKQASLLANNGLLITIIPNAKYLIEFLSDKKTISLHNQSIMNPDSLKKLFGEGLEIKYCGYFGGLFNFGVFGQKKSLVGWVFKFLFALQRLTIDNLEKIFFILTGHDLVSRFSSPSLLCIVRKSDHS